MNLFRLPSLLQPLTFPLSEQNAVERRNKGVRRGIAGSLLSKGTTVVLNFVAFPFAVRILGPAEFAVFVAASSITTFVFIGQIGAGPGLTKRIAKCLASDDPAGVAQIFSASVVVMGAISTLAILTGLWLAQTSYPATWFGLGEAVPGASVRHAFLVITLISGLQLMTSLFIRAQSGFQEGYLGTLTNAAGNLLAVACLLVILPVVPAAWGALLFFYGAVFLAAVINAVRFFLRHRHLLRFDLRGFRQQALFILSDGLAFTVFELSSGGMRELTKAVIGRTEGPEELARLGVLFQLIIAARGLFLLLVLPYLPAIADAYHRRDLAWLRKTFTRSRRLIWLGLASALIAGALIGPQLIEIVYGHHYSYTRFEVVCCCLALAAVVWKFFTGFILIGFDQMWVVAGWSTLEAAVYVSILALFPQAFTLATLLGLLALVSLALSGWIYPCKIARQLRTLETGQGPGTPGPLPGRESLA